MYGYCNREWLTVGYKGVKGLIVGNELYWSDGDDIYTVHSFAEFRQQVNEAYNEREVRR